MSTAGTTGSSSSAARRATPTHAPRSRPSTAASASNVAAVDAGRFGEGKTINGLVHGTVVEHYAEHCEDIDAFFGVAEE